MVRVIGKKSYSSTCISRRKRRINTKERNNKRRRRREKRGRVNRKRKE